MNRSTEGQRTSLTQELWRLVNDLLDTSFAGELIEKIGQDREWPNHEIENLWRGYPQIDDGRVILCLYAIGRGMRLRIPHDGSGPELVDGFAHMKGYPHPPRPTIPLERAIADAMIATGRMHQMARDRVNQRTGWAEKGLDGTIADFYCMK